MKFSIKDFFSRCDQIRMKQRICGYGRLTEEIVNGKLHFLCSVRTTKLRHFKPMFPFTCICRYFAVIAAK